MAERELQKNEFAVLAALEREPGASQRELARRTGLSVGTVNAAAKALEASGLTADGSPTDAGRVALAPYRVENAVIMAAGMSDRKSVV